MKAAVITLAALALAGCGTTGGRKSLPEPEVRIVEKVVPVKVACVPAGTPGAPVYADSDEALKAAAGPEDRYKLVIQGRSQRKARSLVVEPIVEGCR